MFLQNLIHVLRIRMLDCESELQYRGVAPKSPHREDLHLFIVTSSLTKRQRRHMAHIHGDQKPILFVWELGTHSKYYLDLPLAPRGGGGGLIPLFILKYMGGYNFYSNLLVEGLYWKSMKNKRMLLKAHIMFIDSFGDDYRSWGRYNWRFMRINLYFLIFG